MTKYCIWDRERRKQKKTALETVDW